MIDNLETMYIIGKEPEEFKELAEAFQEMAKKLNESFAKLEKGRKSTYRADCEYFSRLTNTHG